MTVVPGSIDQQVKGREGFSGSARLAEGYQTANTIDLLRRCTEILEPEKPVMVLEPLNWHANHGGVSAGNRPGNWAKNQARTCSSATVGIYM